MIHSGFLLMQGTLLGLPYIKGFWCSLRFFVVVVILYFINKRRPALTGIVFIMEPTTEPDKPDDFVYGT